MARFIRDEDRRILKTLEVALRRARFGGRQHLDVRAPIAAYRGHSPDRRTDPAEPPKTRSCRSAARCLPGRLNRYDDIRQVGDTAMPFTAPMSTSLYFRWDCPACRPSAF